MSKTRLSGGSIVEWGGYMEVRKLSEPTALGKFIRSVGLYKAISEWSPKYNFLLASSQEGHGFFFLKDGNLWKRRSRFAVVVGKLKSKGGNMLFSVSDIDRMELALEAPRISESSPELPEINPRRQESHGSFHSAFAFSDDDVNLRPRERDVPGTMLVFLTTKRHKRHSMPLRSGIEQHSAAESRVIEFRSASGRQLTVLHDLLLARMHQGNKGTMARSMVSHLSMSETVGSSVMTHSRQVSNTSMSHPGHRDTWPPRPRIRNETMGGVKSAGAPFGTGTFSSASFTSGADVTPNTTIEATPALVSRLLSQEH